MTIFKGATFGIVGVADLLANLDAAARLESCAHGQGGVATGEAGPLSLGVVEDLQSDGAIESRREVLRQVIDEADPVREADIGNIGGKAVKRLKAVVQP